MVFAQLRDKRPVTLSTGTESRLRGPVLLTTQCKCSPCNRPLWRCSKEKDRTTVPGEKPTKMRQQGNSLPGMPCKWEGAMACWGIGLTMSCKGNRSLGWHKTSMGWLWELLRVRNTYHRMFRGITKGRERDGSEWGGTSVRKYMEKGIKGARRMWTGSWPVHLCDQALSLITAVQPVLLLNTISNYLLCEYTLYCEPVCMNTSKYHDGLTSE